MTQIFLWGLQIGPKLAPKGPNYLKMSLKGSPSIVCLGPVQLEITRIKSYELIILNYLLEGNIWNLGIKKYDFTADFAKSYFLIPKFQIFPSNR